MQKILIIMKNLLFFIGGLLSGIVLTIAAILFLGFIQRNTLIGATYFDQPGDIIDCNSFETFQVLNPTSALVTEHSEYGFNSSLTVYLLVNDENKYYYDDEVIDIPSDKVVRQIGVYKYSTKQETEKTVPIIKIFDE